MASFFMRIACERIDCGWHGGKVRRVKVHATDVETAKKELDEFSKGQPRPESLTCKPQRPQLFELVEVEKLIA